MSKENENYDGRVRQLLDSSKAAYTAGRERNDEQLLAAGRELEALAKRTLAARNSQKPAVLDLEDSATAKELTVARRKQAVRYRGYTYLPVWSASNRIMPKGLLRSALFRSSNDEPPSIRPIREWIAHDGRAITTQSNQTIKCDGPTLGQIERRIFMACLEHYRDQPLNPTTNEYPIETTFYKLAKVMGSAYSAKLHVALRAGLIRLSAVSMTVRTAPVTTEVPRLLDVTLENPGLDNLKAGDGIQFSVPDTLAELFGKGNWTSVPGYAAKCLGLKGWLANFYATQSTAYPLSLESLRGLSGYGAKLSGFRRGLITALEDLMTDKTPEDCRVASYSLSEDKKTVTVIRSSWN